MRNRLLFFLSFFISFFLLVFYFMEIHSIRKGLNFLKKELYSQAQEEFLQAVSNNPSLLKAKMNLAFSYSLLKNYPEALEEYSKVFLASPKKEDRFESYFNSALIEDQKGRLDSALKFYQKALKEQEDSIEVKTNIEWMMKKQEQKQNKKQGGQGEPKKNKEDSSLNKEQPKPSQDSKLDLDPDQVRNLLKEIEKREQEIHSRLKEKPSPKKGNKPW